MTRLAPRTCAEVVDAMRWAVAAREPFEIVGGGSKRSLGRPVSAPHELHVSGLSGVVAYEPAELVLTVMAGTPMREIEALLADRSQCLMFEPPDFAALLGPSELVASTLGGVVATGISGPRRLKAGAVRDHVLGLVAVSGYGESFVAGGKVVKNVTGYDLPKLITGSYGTLAVMTEITVKVLPAAEDQRTLIVAGLDAHAAVRVMSAVLQSAVDVSAACHFPREVSVLSEADSSVTAFRLEGVSPSVAFRLAALDEQVASAGPVRVLDREESASFWRDVRDVRPFAASGSAAETVWRLSVPPASGARVIERIRHAIPRSRAFMDWGGGLVWLAQSAPNEGANPLATAIATAARIREALAESGGHATLFRAPADVRAGVEVFQPQEPALAALSKRVKAHFDPLGVLNPGRLYAGV